MVLDSQRANSRHMQHIYLALFTTHLRFFPLSSMAIIAKPPRRKCSFSANANSSGLEDGASSQSKNIISELRSVHDLARVDRYVFPNLIHTSLKQSSFRPQEKKPEDSGGRKSKAGVTIVRVGGSRGDVNNGVARGTEALGGSSSARFSHFLSISNDDSSTLHPCD